MRVVGVDPGLTRCGLSVIESRRGQQIIALDVDVVGTLVEDLLPQQLLTISEHVEHWLDIHHLDVLAIERVFPQQNVSTVMGTAQAGGVIALAAAKCDIGVHFHIPSEVRAAVTGNGGAGKAQVTAMVTRTLGLQANRLRPTPPTPWRWRSATAGAPMIAPVGRRRGQGGRTAPKVRGEGEGRNVIASQLHRRDR